MRLPSLSSVLCLIGILTTTHHVQAAKEMFVRTKPHVNVSTVNLFTEEDEVLTAEFESDLIVSTKDRAWGVFNLTFPGGAAFKYEAVAGRLEFDESGGAARIWVLLRLPDSHPRDPLGYAQVVIRRSIGDCLIYDFVGPAVADGRLWFEVEASITEAAKPKSRREILEE